MVAPDLKMTSPTGNPTNAKSRAGSGFTLLELILVMAIMLIVLGVTYSSLKSFFHGHNLEYEARRFMSLTRNGQSQAVSEGVPMILWMNPKLGTYGLQPQLGYTTASSNMVEFTVDPEVKMEVQMPSTTALMNSNLWTQTTPPSGGQMMIRFLPDGFIGETSPQRIFFRQGEKDVVSITETTNRVRYEIDNNQYQNAQR